MFGGLLEDHRPLVFAGNREEFVGAGGERRPLHFDGGAEGDERGAVGTRAPDTAIRSQRHEGRATPECRAPVDDLNVGDADSLLDGGGRAGFGQNEGGRRHLGEEAIGTRDHGEGNKR